VKEEQSFGFWSPRRCDVYVVSYHPGYLQERLEVVSYLWQHNISADLMYGTGLPNADHENHLEICASLLGKVFCMFCLSMHYSIHKSYYVR